MPRATCKRLAHRLAKGPSLGLRRLSSASGYCYTTSAPSAPTQVAATVDITKANVTWQSGCDGESPITGSRASAYTRSSGGTTVQCCPTTGTGLGCTITGLANGTTSYIEVMANNAVGTSAASSPGIAVTPVAP